MARKRMGQQPAVPEKGGPIKPGSILHHALQVIAREVAKCLANSPMPKNREGPMR
jgi:hypothetical protein